jgi:hypothetical protein
VLLPYGDLIIIEVLVYLGRKTKACRNQRLDIKLKLYIMVLFVTDKVIKFSRCL